MGKNTENFLFYLDDYLNEFLVKKRVIKAEHTRIENKQNKVRWSEKEEEELATIFWQYSYFKGLYIKKFQEKNPQRTIRAIENKAYKLGLTSELRLKKAEEKLLGMSENLTVDKAIREWRSLPQIEVLQSIFLIAALYEIKIKNKSYIGHAKIAYYRIRGYNREEEFYETDRPIIKAIHDARPENVKFRIIKVFKNKDKFLYSYDGNTFFNEALFKKHMENEESQVIHRYIKKGIELLNLDQNPVEMNSYIKKRGIRRIIS